MTGRSASPTGTEAASESGSAHALRLIEFPRVLELVSECATSGLGAERVAALRPLTHREAVDEALSTTDDMITFLLRTSAWAPPPIPDLRPALRRLTIEGSILDETALRDMAILLSSSRRARQEIRRRSDDFRRVGALAEGLIVREREEERLERSIDATGEIADAASPALGRLRRQMRSERSSLVERLGRFAAQLPDRFRVPDASVTLRSGRYCVPIRREGRSRVGGIVHDESASSQTLFVEPPLAIEPMNRIRELELAERREVQRVLAELTELLRPLSAALSRSLEALAELDALFARARFALEHGGARPAIGPPSARGPYVVRRAYHPILRAVDERAVPFDLEIASDESVLLVSGPNAGGKTVLLKALGLISAMAQSGIVPPVGEGTSLPVFSSFFAIMGDEQSIEASLSTFSAQIGYLREILDRSDGRSLVLIDEIGSSTDPEEGAALASAALLRLAGQAALTAVSTHLGDLKLLAGEDARIVNASLQFDPNTLRPTYRLLRDRPGRSYALEICERLGIAADVLEAARSRLSREARALETVLAELEKRGLEAERQQGALEAERRDLVVERQRLTERYAAAERREAELDGRERELEREGRRRAEKYLLDARKEVEGAIARLSTRMTDAMATLSSASRQERQRVFEESRSAGTEARRAVERTLDALRQKASEVSQTEDLGTSAMPPPALEVGDRVRLPSLGGVGRLLELEKDRAVVELRGVRITLAPGDLRAGGETEETAGEGRRSGSMWVPVLEAASEVDLRGLRADELEAALLPVLDAAIHADLPSLRIIHGKGTGALRECVQALLAKDARVRGYRLGTQGEGGSGVTIVDLSERE
jgi:DNA mismatch repair protein MutS2